MSGDTFTADKLAWVEQVARDPHIGHLAARVATLLAVSYLNRGTEDAWPSQETLAADLSVTSRAIRTAVGQLSDGGHLTVEVRKGTGVSSRYRPILKSENRNEASASFSPRTGTRLPVPEAENRKFSAPRTGSRLPTNPMKEPSEPSVCDTQKVSLSEEDALSTIRAMLDEAKVQGDPLSILRRCQSHHGDAWAVRLTRWTKGAIDRAPKKAVPVAIPVTYDGPPEIRADVVAARGEAYAASYIDRCTWRDEDRTLIAANPFAARRLVEDMGREWLQRRGCSVGVPVANDAGGMHGERRQTWR